MNHYKNMLLNQIKTVVIPNLNSRLIRTCAGLSYLFRNMSLVGLHTYYITAKIMNIKLIL